MKAKLMHLCPSCADNEHVKCTLTLLDDDGEQYIACECTCGRGAWWTL